MEFWGICNLDDGGIFAVISCLAESGSEGVAVQITLTELT